MRILFRRRGLRLGLPCVLVGVAAGIAALAGITASPVAGSTVATGTLEMNASLHLEVNGLCKPVGIATDCHLREVGGSFRGLGRVTGSYDFEMDLGSGACESGLGKALSYPIRLEVAGKGAIDVVTTETACVTRVSVTTETQAFTVTGGTGIYAEASGTGTLERKIDVGYGPLSHIASGIETWKGTLTVPGLSFDVVKPTLVGAKSRTVLAPRHAKRVRVKFVVTATDAVDGPVPVKCRPGFGSRFRIGRNRVHCSATDTSANPATASFTITVRQHR
jgi:HYR domain